MKPESQREKLAALRAKTDQQLFRLVLHQLETAIVLLGTQPADGNAMTPSRAENAYRDAVLLLPTMKGLSAFQKRLVEQRIEELRMNLEQASTRTSTRTRTAGC